MPRAGARTCDRRGRPRCLQEGPDQDVDHDRLPVRQVAEQDRVGEGEADPVDPEEGHGDRPDRRPGGRQREAEGHRKRDHGHQQDLELGAVVGRQQQPGEGQQTGQPHRAGPGVHPVELVQADPPEHDQPDREDEAPFDHQEQGHRDRRDRGEHPGAEIRPPLPPTTGPPLPAPAPPSGSGLPLPAVSRPGRSSRGSGSGGHQRRPHRPPNRRCRSAYSASDSSSASRVKSGHSSSRNTSSE